MATALKQSLKVISSRVIKKSFQVNAQSVSKLISAQKVSTRGLTLNRNIWCAVSDSSVILKTQQLSKARPPLGCCSYYSEVDASLVKFLSNEILSEKELIQKSPNIEGWNAKTDGSGVVLTKQFRDETIKVEFDVNHSVESDGLPEDDNDPAAQSNTLKPKIIKMVSRPPFEVKIIKKSGKTLRFLCEFTERNIEPAEQGDENIDDQFNIVEVHLDKESKDSEGFDNSYSHSGSVMDPVLYESLMDMLDERGVDDNFITHMQEFSTTYEHQLYVQFLENLKLIVNEKRK